MTNDELKLKYSALLDTPLSMFSVFDVRSVNHRPHPFCIGTKHVVEASDNHCGMLTEEVCRKIPCAMRGCAEPFESHTADRVLILQLTRDASQEEARTILKGLADTMQSDGLDGITFLKSAFTFKQEELSPCTFN